MLGDVAWHLHAVQGDDGWWTCRHGLSVYDSHPDQEAALDHLRKLAEELGRGTVILVHGLGAPVIQAD